MSAFVSIIATTSQLAPGLESRPALAISKPAAAAGVGLFTAHLIVAEHATRDGTSKGFSRARKQTHIYARVEGDREADSLAAIGCGI